MKEVVHQLALSPWTSEIHNIFYVSIPREYAHDITQVLITRVDYNKVEAHDKIRPLHRLQHDVSYREDELHVHTTNSTSTRSTCIYYFISRLKILCQILGKPTDRSGNFFAVELCFSPSNRQPDEADEPSNGRYVTSMCYWLRERMGSTFFANRVRLQQ